MGIRARLLAAGRARARVEDCTIRPPLRGGDPPSGSANGGDARAAGTRARRGPLPRARVPRGRGCCSQSCLFIYFQCVLYVAIATVPSFPESQGHRCFQTFPGQGLLRGFPFFCGRRGPGRTPDNTDHSGQIAPPSPSFCVGSLSIKPVTVYCLPSQEREYLSRNFKDSRRVPAPMPSLGKTFNH